MIFYASEDWADYDYIPEKAPSTQPDGTAGSGCAPPDADTLPDGVWRGLVEAHTDTSIEFDLVCSWTHDSDDYQDALAAYENPGHFEHVVNTDTATRTLTLDTDVQAHAWHDRYEGVASGSVGEVIERNGPSMWVFINDGRVTEIMESYWP